MKSLLVCLVCLPALLGNSALGADALNMGFYLPGIRDANLVDVRFTLKFWAEEVGKIYDIDATASTYADMASLRRDMRSGAIQMVTSLSIGMMSPRMPRGLRARVLDSAPREATTVRGRQILEIFKTDYMERVDVHELQPYWSLHRDLRDSAPGKLKRSR